MKTIRLWNLGYINPANPSNSILPTKASFEKLRELIKSDEGGVLDIIWGPELSLTIFTYDETKNEVADFITNEEGKLVEL
jgi:hypothetical protein